MAMSLLKYLSLGTIAVATAIVCVFQSTWLETCPTLPAQEAELPITMSTEVIAAMENGPLIVAITLTSREKAMRKFYGFRDEDGRIEVPKQWGGKSYDVIILGGDPSRPAFVQLEPGATLTRIVAVHNRSTIPSGPHELRSKWILREFGKPLPDPLPQVEVRLPDGMTLITQPEGPRPPAVVSFDAPLRIDIPKRTEASVGALVRSLEKRLDEARKPDDVRIVLKCLEGVDLPALEPIALRLLTRDRWIRNQAMYWMFEYLDWDRVTAIALQHVCDPKVRNPHDWLDHWRGKAQKPAPTAEQLRRMREAPSLWTRLSALLWFPQAFNKTEADELLREAGAFHGPVTADQLRPLVAQLDDPKFAKREEASAFLADFGTRALPALRALAARPTSAEVESRLKTIMATIEKRAPDEAETLFVSGLPSYVDYYPNTRPILEALAKNAPEAQVTQQAKEALAKLDAAKPSIPK
jgi:hypothetical protein